MRFQMSPCPPTQSSRISLHQSPCPPTQSTLDRLTTSNAGASYGRLRNQWRLSAPRFVHHHRHRSYAGVWSAQIGPRAFRNGHGAYLPRQALISPLGGLEPVRGV